MEININFNNEYKNTKYSVEININNIFITTTPEVEKLECKQKKKEKKKHFCGNLSKIAIKKYFNLPFLLNVITCSLESTDNTTLVHIFYTAYIK